MAPSHYWLLLCGPEGNAAGYSLPRGEYVFGREDLKAHFGIRNDTVSSEHMSFLATDSGCSVEDRSRNGTWRNATRLTRDARVTLSDGDLLTIGEQGGFQTTLKFVDDLQRSARELPRLWWLNWVDREPGTGAATITLPLLEQGSTFLLQHLPECYRQGPDSFTRRFLALFEHVLLPLGWNTANFDLFLDPKTAPPQFLSWLAQWHRIAVDASWTEPQRRRLLADAPFIFPRLGTAAALRRVLEIYTGGVPEIRSGGELPPNMFEVRVAPNGRSEEQLRNVIDAYKPIHADYRMIINDGL